MSSTERADSSATFQQLIGFWRWTPAARIFFADDAICDLFGIDPAVGRAGETVNRFGDNIHRDDREGVFQRIGSRMAEGRDFSERYRLIDKHRRVRSVLSIGRRFESGVPGELCYVGALFGIDDHPIDISPSYAAAIEALISAKTLADSLGETMLARLTEAVLLEAGRSYARALEKRAD